MSRAVITRYQVTTEYPMSAPIRIAHVSDLHERPANDILQFLRESAPDLIVVTGDTFERYDNRPQYDFHRRPLKRLLINIIHYTNWFLIALGSGNHAHDTEHARGFLRNASALAPVYLSLGNHEEKLLDEDVRFLSDAGVHLLDNAFTFAEIKGFRLCIGGMSCWNHERFWEDYQTPKGCFKLLLLHKPDQFEPDVAESDVDLTLSGHTHGGQFRVGKRGFFVPGQGLFGKLAHGSFFNGRLIVSSGCSNTVAFPRLFNPRELVLIDLIPHS